MKLGETASHPMDFGGVGLEVGASVGVSLGLSGESADDVIDRADAAMCRAKVESRPALAVSV